MYALEDFKKTHHFICPECGREIRNCYSEYHAFNVHSGDDEVMCAYCWFDEYACEIMENAKEFDEKYPGFFSKKLEIKNQIATMGNGTYETLQNYYNVDPDEIYDEYTSKILFTLSSDLLAEMRGIPPETNFVRRAEAYLDFHGEVYTIGLRIVRTDNNMAIIYQHDFDVEFLKYDGRCPYYDYYMAREVADRFTVLESEEDMIYRLKALKTIKEWENTADFDDEIKFLEDKITMANGKLPYSSEAETYAEKIRAEILDKITGAPERIMTAFSDDEKLGIIGEYKRIIEDVKKDKYVYNGKILDLDTIVINDSRNTTLSEDFLIFFELGFNTITHSYVMFEEWKLTKNESSLIECLSSLKRWIFHITDICPEISFESGLPESDNPVYKLFKSMIDRFIYFYKAYKKQLNEFRNTGILKRLDYFKSSFLLQSFSGYDENTLTEESLAVYTANLIESLTLLHNILLLVKNHYDELYNETKDSQVLKLGNMLTDATGEFKNYFDKLIDIFYVSRNVFIESAEKEYGKPSGSNETIRILKQLGEMLKSLRNAGSITDIFEVKKSYFAQITTDESIHEEIEKILDIIVSILNDRCTNQAEYQQIYNSIKNEFSSKKVALSDSVTKTVPMAAIS